MPHPKTQSDADLKTDVANDVANTSETRSETKGALSELKKLSFWFKKVAAHPCCIVPLATGGSIQIFGAHNTMLELGVGAALVVGVEEGSRLIHKFRHASKNESPDYNASCSPTCSSHDKLDKSPLNKSPLSSRFASYALAVPLFLGSYALSHHLFPHDGHEDHNHAHHNSAIEEDIQSLEIELCPDGHHPHHHDHEGHHHEGHDHNETDQSHHDQEQPMRRPPKNFSKIMVELQNRYQYSPCHEHSPQR